MTIKTALQHAILRLKRHNCPETDPIREAGLFVSATTGLDRTSMATRPETELTESQVAELKTMIDRRLRHEPVEMIIGFADFFGLRLEVTGDTLIPRPATEALLEAARPDFSRIQNMTVDVGTGSGAIALAVAAEARLTGPIFGTEMSPEALEVAKRNAKNLGMDHLVKFKKGNLLKPVSDMLRYHVGPITIIANLPYIPDGQWENLPAEIRKFEPKTALTGGPNGIDFYFELTGQLKKIWDTVPDWLSVYLEILPEQYGPLSKAINDEIQGLILSPLKHDNGLIFGLKASTDNAFRDV